MPTNSVSASSVSDTKLLIGGRWEASDSSRWGEVFNPSTGRVIARVPSARRRKWIVPCNRPLRRFSSGKKHPSWSVLA
jgi:acyl-CoA reductase-like NAD-dependent aldehyde dehydrogenase